MKYELVKSISIDRIKNTNPCADKFAEFVKRLILEDISYASSGLAVHMDIAVRIAEELGEVQYLIDHGFIREVEPEVFYEVGDELNRENTIYQVSQSRPFEVSLIVIQGDDKGNRFSNPVRVDNIRKITKTELSEMCGGYASPEDFTKL